MPARTPDFVEENTGRAHAVTRREKMLQMLVTAEELERERISRELHNDIGQHVAALLLGLKEIERPLARHPAADKTLQRLRGIAEQIGRDIHEVALELRPASLSDLGLVRCLANFMAERTDRTKIAVDFDHEEFGATRLPDHLETTLYRVICEAVQNVTRHAGATRVAVILRRSESGVMAIIEDNGVGFDVVIEQAKTPRPRLGLAGMRERVALVGGKLTIESEPEKGTTVIVRLPLPSRKSHG